MRHVLRCYALAAPLFLAIFTTLHIDCSALQSSFVKRTSFVTSSRRNVNSVNIIRQRKNLFLTPKPSSVSVAGQRSNIVVMTATEQVNVVSTKSCSAPTWRTYPEDFDGAKQSFPLDHESDTDANWSEFHYRQAYQFYQELEKCDDAYIAPKISEALKCLESAYRLYGPRHVVSSYNGGKDAVAIVHLMRAAHAKYLHDEAAEKTEKENGVEGPIMPQDGRHRPRVIYFDDKDQFPEIRSLLHSTVEAYDIDMLEFSSSHTFKDGLQVLVDAAGKQKQQLAFVLGTRSSDPNAYKQGLFSPSSHYMPPFMRVNPILNWSYGHVWHFLRYFQLPYCCLYDQGYTSLGNVHDTLPCPDLERPQGGFWPAYMLSDWDKERAGRIDKKQQKKKGETSTSKERSKSKPSADEQQQQQQPELHPSISTVSLASAAVVDNGSDDGQTPTPYPGRAASSTASVGSESGMSTVGLLIIGDEILKGQCCDANMYAAATAFRANGVILSRVVVVPDEHDEIVTEIKRMQKAVDIVVTSGGVGPTHDDVTMRSVSSALSSPLVFHKEMADLLREKMGAKGEGVGENGEKELSEGQKKMATLPRNAKLRYLGGEDEWPTLQCRNIYILPGVPQFFEKKVTAVASKLASSHFERTVTYNVVLSVEESTIVNSLNDVVERHPHVSFGSYPFVDHPDFKTVVTLEGKEGPSRPGDTRTSIRRRGGASLRRLSELRDSYGSASEDEDSAAAVADDLTSLGLFTKNEIDLHVKLALADLIGALPASSILRVSDEEALD